MKPRLSAGPLALVAGEVTGEPEVFLSSECNRQTYTHTKQTREKTQW